MLHCELWQGMHRMVFVGERVGRDRYECACGASMLNASDAWYPDETRYVVIEPEEEQEALNAPHAHVWILAGGYTDTPDSREICTVPGCGARRDVMPWEMDEARALAGE